MARHLPASLPVPATDTLAPRALPHCFLGRGAPRDIWPRCPQPSAARQAHRAAAVGRSCPVCPQDTPAASPLWSETRLEMRAYLGVPRRGARVAVRTVGDPGMKRVQTGAAGTRARPLATPSSEPLTDDSSAGPEGGPPGRALPAGLKGRQTVCCPHSSEARDRHEKDGGPVLPPPRDPQECVRRLPGRRGLPGAGWAGVVTGAGAGHAADLIARGAATRRRDANPVDVYVQ